MSGLLFVVCVPTEHHELGLINEEISVKTTGHDSTIPIYHNDVGVSSSNNEDKSQILPTVENKNFLSLPVQNVSKRQFVKCETHPELISDSETERSQLCMERVLAQVLKDLKISDAVWNTAENNLFKQVTFFMASGRPSEEALRMLTECGIGTQMNSVVSVIPCSIFNQGNDASFSSWNKNEPDVQVLNQSDYQREASAWGRFIESGRPRLILAQVLHTVNNNAQLTFDFIALLVIAAISAALALVENSLVILVSSMLFSPLMRPIMAGMFGTVIKDKKLQKMGICNEILGLLLCVLIGFLFGLVVSISGSRWGTSEWPTEEMISKGELRSLWVGVIVALMSGVAIAIGILRDDTGSLIGVAISVALLPPAVNAGLLWSLSVVNLVVDNSETFSQQYSPLWSKNPSIELAILGGISLCLTILNIVCIFIAGILVLKIESVTPSRLRRTNQSSPWNPLKLARDYKTLANEEVNDDKKLAADAFPPEDCPQSTNTGMAFNNFKYQSDLMGVHQLTWSPASSFARAHLTAHDLSSFLHQVTVRQPSTSWATRPPLATCSWLLAPGRWRGETEDDQLPSIPEAPSRSARFIVTPARQDSPPPS